MRILLPLVLAALLALPAAAQPPTFDDPYQARLGLGDIPTTQATEGPGWNVAIQVRVEHASGAATQVVVALPTGFAHEESACTCTGHNITVGAAAVTLDIPASAPATTGTFSVLAHRDDATSLALDIMPTVADAVVLAYVPNGRSLTSSVPAATTLATTDGTATIHQFGGAANLPATLALSIAPASATATSTDGAGTAEAGFPWLYVALAFIAGALVWAALVARGLVQARSRKQLVAPAAHEVAAAEPKPVLEARKRALMAAMKELEIAKMNGELETAAYDAVKADLKKQTVAVMRALEAA